MTRPTFRFVRNSLKDIIETRRLHVHVTRYGDKDFNRLDSIDLFHSQGFNISSADNLFDSYYKFTYRSIRNKWKKRLKNNRAELAKLVDIYSGVIIQILFDEKTGELIYSLESKS